MKSIRLHMSLVALLLGWGSVLTVQAAWKAVPGKIMTRWASQVTPDNAHSEYPRPMLVRKAWQNLNGLWDYAIRPQDQSQPGQFDGKILVPFPIESALSGVKKAVGEKNRLWYHRTFIIPKAWGGKRLLLHFEAVDWETTAWVNGKRVGTHRGGYDPFYFDITDAVKAGGEQDLVLSVWDPTDASFQPRGKQVRKPNGIWYTANTGIWATAWVEPVGQAYIKAVRIVPDIDREQARLTVEIAGTCRAVGLKVQVSKDGREVSSMQTGISNFLITVPKAELWSPETPNLYDLQITLSDGDKVVDSVSSYFGMRKIEVKKDKDGFNRLFLNNRVLFQFGPLDQGWWPDGLYTAPSDDALRYDIEVLKRLGCNMLRKHVKVEPRRFYYWCDKLGMLVWQDMPSGDRYISGKAPDIKRSPASEQCYYRELTAMLDTHYSHPCIVMWVPFNEGWGQYDTAGVTRFIEEYDPSRLVDSASGWTDRGVGDVHDIHRYPGPAMPPVEEKRAAVLGEFGGLGLPIAGHTWQEQKNWGYRSYKDAKALTQAYLGLIERLRPLIGKGLSAAVYTQTTDVEIECNGLMTYDRALIKMDTKQVSAANRTLYLPPPVIKTVVPDARTKAQNWFFTTSKPSGDWFKADFDATDWQKGKSGFGSKGTPGAIINTPWKTSDIWLRRWFKLSAGRKLKGIRLAVHHDEDAEVYINGRQVASLEGFTSDYINYPLNKDAATVIRSGRNLLAIHCHQTSGGQYIDAGLVRVIEQVGK